MLLKSIRGCSITDIYRVSARDPEPLREVVEGVGLGADGVVPRCLAEQSRRPVHAQLADVHVRLGRAHRTTLAHI